MTTNQENFLRFTKDRRVEHWLLFLSFTTLAITGLIQKYSTLSISVSTVALLGGIQSVRIIHRIAALMFGVESIYHFVVLGYKLYVQRVKPTMMIGIKDGVDAVNSALFNLGIKQHPPKMGRYNFAEKAEYWALIWGLILMGTTGLMLWNPILTTKLLPGQFIPAAKVAHGWEALLAVLAIILWHFYHAHIKRWNWSMFKGTLSREEMEEEHMLELEEIERGDVHVPPAKEVAAQRRKRYLPIATAAAVGALVLLFVFLSYEETAIATVPPLDEQGAVFVPQTPTPFPTRAPTATPKPGTALPAGPMTWETGIGDIFEQRCGSCHGAMGSLSVRSYEDLMKGGSSGPVVIAGDAANSLAVTKVAEGKHPGVFQPAELEKIIEWINAGATK